MKTTSLAIHSTISTLPTTVLATISFFVREKVRTDGLEILPPRLRYSVFSPLGNGPGCDLAHVGDLGGSAELIDKLVVVHARNLRLLRVFLQAN